MARATEGDRMKALLRLAKRLRRAGRTTATAEDRKVVGGEVDVSPGTIACWMSRYPDEWVKAQEAAGLQTVPAFANGRSSRHGAGERAKNATPADLETASERRPFANADDLAPEFEIADNHQDPRVSQQQMRAIILDLNGGMLRQEIAAAVGAHPATVSAWFNHDPAVQAVRRELELEIVQRVQGAYLAILSETTRAQVLLAREVRMSARGLIVDEETGKRAAWDPENLGRLARAATIIGADAADRAGFPKTTVQQHQLREPDADADLDGMTLEELEAEAKRLAAAEAGLLGNVIEAEFTEEPSP